MNNETYTAERLIYAIACAAGDEEAAKRVENARTTRRRIENGEQATGATRLAELLGRDVVERAATWFGLGRVPLVEPEHLTDTGNANRLVKRYGDNLKFCHTTQSWCKWQGNRWKEDNAQEIVQLAKQVPSIVRQEASRQQDEAERKKILSWAQKSESAASLNNMIRLAQSDPRVSIQLQEFDTNLMHFNCNIGTIDLSTGALLPHNKKDLISKIAPVDYDSSASRSRWLDFLDVVTVGRPQITSFLQRAIGYALTGSTNEQVLFYLYGASGANGKSTILEAVRATVGDYGAQADFSTLLCGPEGRARNDLARLVGKRFVTAVEVGRGQALSEVVVKQITGSDTITARFLYCESFEFVPQFKLFLAANHSPKVPRADDAFARRILVIPFEAHIPPERRNRNLLNQLLEERSGILAWAVEGCLMYQREGLNPPPEVDAASRACRAKLDPIQSFLASECSPDPEKSTLFSKLYEAYEQFCSEKGLFCETDHMLGSTLEKLGYSNGRLEGQYARKGITLKKMPAQTLKL